MINQVDWAYSVGTVMLPFRHLVKWDLHFIWNKNLEDSFEHSKNVIVDLVRKGISTFEKCLATCLAPDWSKEGMGFLLLQKSCSCDIEKAPVSCPEGWCLIFAGSRFCIDARRRYATIKGEATVITWALEKCHMFLMFCPNLILVTDHETLKVLLGDRDISNPTPIIQVKGENSQVQINHSALPWEEAESLCCRLSQPSSHLAGAPKCIPCWTLSVRHHRVWRHGRLGQINNPTSNIRGERQHSANLTWHYSDSWTQGPAIQC